MDVEYSSRQLPCSGLPVFLNDGRRVELVDSKFLCAFLTVSKPATLVDMANRGDLPPPVHLNTALKGKRGRNQLRWNLPAVMRHLGLAGT